MIKFFINCCLLFPMGLFSSGPSYTDREEKMLDLVFNSSNDGKRRDAISKLARSENATTALDEIVYDHNEQWIRKEAIDKLEYARGKEELMELAFDLSDEELSLMCVEALDSINAGSELAEIAQYDDGRVGRRASKLM